MVIGSGSWYRFLAFTEFGVCVGFILSCGCVGWIRRFSIEVPLWAVVIEGVEKRIPMYREASIMEESWISDEFQ